MATNKQRQTHKVLIDSIVNKGSVLTMQDAMIKGGYSPQVARNPKVVTESKGWQELLLKYNDELLMDRLNDIALDNEDKRSSIEAIKEIFKLKDRYPAQRSKIIGLFDKISELEDGQ